ncbi:hypothetical protein GE09DRAFT_573965 [Coniochaeta sp. 2T2.1]|nr:hypothetical protein GE09DRAFT_573965 [Coniochaeta sp. 2T2.1]
MQVACIRNSFLQLWGARGAKPGCISPRSGSRRSRNQRTASLWESDRVGGSLRPRNPDNATMRIYFGRGAAHTDSRGRVRHPPIVSRCLASEWKSGSGFGCIAVPRVSNSTECISVTSKEPFSWFTCGLSDLWGVVWSASQGLQRPLSLWESISAQQRVASHRTVAFSLGDRVQKSSRRPSPDSRSFASCTPDAPSPLHPRQAWRIALSVFRTLGAFHSKVQDDRVFVRQELLVVPS